MPLAMSIAELTAVGGLAVVLLAYLVASLRFIYRMEGRVDSVAAAVTRVEGELRGLRNDFKEQITELRIRTDSVDRLLDATGDLKRRLEKIEDRRSP